MNICDIESRTRILWTTSTPGSRNRLKLVLPPNALTGIIRVNYRSSSRRRNYYYYVCVDEEDIRNDIYCSSGRIRLNEDGPYLNVKQDNLQHMLIYLTLHNQLRPVSSPGIQGNHPRC